MSAEVFIESVGLVAPGLPNWQASQAILRDEQAYVAEPLPPYAPTSLPPNERRRAPPGVKLAFQAAEDAITQSSLGGAALASVFTSSDADLGIIHRICTALAATPRVISPTDFHNSVHNAAAGYWSIALGARLASSTLSAHDYSFAMGLLEACGIVSVDGHDTLLVAFDLPPPEPLLEKRPIALPMAVGMVLTRRATARSLAALRCSWTDEPETKLVAELDTVRIGNPAARALPLLRLLAQTRSGRVVLPGNAAAGLAIELAAR